GRTGSSTTIPCNARLRQCIPGCAGTQKTLSCRPSFPRKGQEAYRSGRNDIMKLMQTLMTATALVAVMAGSAYAKTLIYCSEGSPEGFDPAPYTAGTTFDAASRPIYNRLYQFKKGSSETEPGLAESYEVSDDGSEYTFKLR